MMKDYSVKDISEDSFFSEPLYIDSQFIVATPEMPLQKTLLTTLLVWDFKEVYSDGEPKDYSFAKNADIAKAAAKLLKVNIKDKDTVIACADEFYVLFQRYVEELFANINISEGNKFKFEAIIENIQVVCHIIQKDRRFLLWAQQKHSQEGNYQVTHAVNSMVISIIIGSVLKLSEQKLVELGVAALLHEIGMMKLPPRIYLTKLTLTPEERKTILTHPILGYKMLKAFGFPLAVCLAALEHHERENSAGYPQKLPGDKISLYAKIIAVACSYEALTSNRPYKQAKDKHRGIMDLLKNEGKQYDDTIVHALVYALSVYPIGLYVLLSNGKKAQVVDVNPENPRFPVVQIFRTKEEESIILQTTPQLSVTRPLAKTEIPD
jgi:HD-GYP domain-containing protein (c-di-GMP phosphodiesterase class II)